VAYKSISARVNSANSVANPTALTPVLPTRATGDLLIAITSCRSITATVATPSGWTIWPGFPKRSGTASGGSIYVFYKEVVGGEANPTLSWSGVATGTTGDSSQACIVCLDNVEVASPSDVTPPAATDASAAGPSIPDLTTASTDAIVVGIGMKVIDTATTGTIANSFTERGDFHTTTGTGHQLYVATRQMAAPAATGASAITESPTTAARCLAVALAVKEHVPVTLFGAVSRPITFGKSVAGDIPPPAVVVTYVNGAGAESAAAATTLACAVPTGGYPAGSLVVVEVSGLANENASSTMTDDAGNVYTKAASINHSSGGLHTALWWSILDNALSAAQNITHGYNQSVTGRGVSHSCYTSSEGWPANPIASTETDEEVSWNNLTTVDAFAGTLKAGVGVYGFAKNLSGAVTPGTGFTDAYDAGFASPAFQHASAYRLRADAAGAYSVGGSWTGNANAVIAGAHFNSNPIGGTVMQTKAGQTDNVEGASVTLTFDTPTVTGRAIVVSVAGWDTGNAAMSFTCTDNKGNTYSTVPGAAAESPGHAWVQQFYCIDITGGASHQITVASASGNANYIQAEAMEVIGLGTASPLDTSVENATQGFAGTSTTGNITPTVDDFVVAAMTEDGGFTVSGVSVGWSESYDGNTGQPLHTAYRTAPAGTTACVFTMSGSQGSAAVALALKIGAVVSGPTTYYGATSLAATVGAVTQARRQTFSQVAQAMTFGAVVAGISGAPAVTHYGAVAMPTTVTTAVAGQRKTFGVVARPTTVTTVVAAQRKTFGVVVRPTTFGAVVAATRKTFSALALPITNTRVVAGIRKVLSAVALPVAVTTAVAATRKTFSAVAMPITTVRAVAGRKQTFGVIARPTAATITVAGRKQTFGAIVMPITTSRAVAGQRKTFGIVARPTVFGAAVSGIVTVGAITHYGQVARPTTTTIVTAGTRKTFSQIAMPITSTRAVAGVRKAFGVVARPTTATIVVSARRKTFGVVTLPIVNTRYVVGQVQGNITARLSFDVNAIIAVTGRRTTRSTVTLPVTAAIAVAGRRSTTSTVALPVTAVIATTGLRKTFGVSSLPIAFSATTSSFFAGTVLNLADMVYLGGPVDAIRTDSDLVWTP
jgi:hypothetical protein